MGDYVLLYHSDKVKLIVRAEPGKIISTIKGNIKSDDIIGLEYGCKVKSSLGYEFIVTRPSLDELMLEIYDRPTQVIYPKDAALIILKCEIASGCTVVEAGSGSGFMTTFLAMYVRPGGKVYSYERRPEFLSVARRNVSKLGLEESVEFRLRDVLREGFDLPDNSADAVILDLLSPWELLGEVYRVLKHGRKVAIYLPSILQVERVLRSYARHGFIEPEIVEVLVRRWKPVAEELRPDTWMIAHTGFIVFLKKP